MEHPNDARPRRTHAVHEVALLMGVG